MLRKILIWTCALYTSVSLVTGPADSLIRTNALGIQVGASLLFGAVLALWLCAGLKGK